MSNFARPLALPLALTALLATGAAANAHDEYLFSGRTAEDMAKQCYDPSSTDPQYVISICTRFLNETTLNEEPWAYATRAVAYLHAGRLDDALDDLDEAIRLSPRDYQYLADYFQYRCLTQLNRAEARDALEDCNTSLKLRPNDPTTREFRGDVHYALKDYQAAVADLDASLALRPENAGALYVRGLARTRAGDATGGQADISAARTKRADIAKDYPGM